MVLFAAPFDARALTVTGPGERMGDGVKMIQTGFGLGHAVMSSSGDVVYVNEYNAGLLMYRDAEGRLSSALPDTLAIEHPRFSPDARRLVVTIVDSVTSRRTLGVLDRAYGFFAPLAGHDPSSGRDRAEWTPDGRSILFRSITDSLRCCRRQASIAIVSAARRCSNDHAHLLAGARVKLLHRLLSKRRHRVRGEWGRYYKS